MSVELSQIPALQPKLVMGLNTSVKSNAHFIGDEEVVYPVGGLLVIHNFNQHKQKYIKLSDRGANVTHLVVSPNRRLMAVAETGERPFATLFETTTYKKKKQITIPNDKECSTKEFACLSFTQDNKNIVAVTGEPDWTLYLYKVDKARVESSCRANNLNNVGTIVQICCNPNDPNLLVLVGDQTLRMMACFENNWRQFGFNKVENITLTSGAWISQDRLMVGTVNGKLLMIESGELKAIHFANSVATINYKAEDEPQQGALSLTNLLDQCAEPKLSDELHVRAIFAFGKGFAFACGRGVVHLFERESPHKYQKRNVFHVPDHTVTREELDTENEKKGEPPERCAPMNEVRHLGVNVSEDRLLATCDESQIYVMRLWGADLSAQPEFLYFGEMGMNLHHGPIGGMDVCSWKPIFMTSGAYDRTLRIWNYETDTLELMKIYLEDICGLALHPSGFFAVVGFSDKLRFLTILTDDFNVTREFPIRNCQLIVFSKLGHLFAAAHGNIIQVYSSISFEHMFNLKGHTGKVTGMSWVHDDYKMVSCGFEGAVYEWQISTTRRISETIVKSCQFSDANITGDGKSVFAVGSDGRIREIMNCNIHRDVKIVPNCIDKVVLSNSDMMLFVTGNDGIVFSVKLPILENAEYLEYVVHANKVTHMKITNDDKNLITCSNDGTICIWRLLNTEGKAIKLDKEFVYSSDILIPKTDLDHKLNMIKDLQLRMHELETEHAYQMRQVETMHNAAVREIHEGYCEAIEELKEKNEQLEMDHTNEMNTINQDISKMKNSHEDFIQKLENNYNEKLIIEYEKYIKLEEKMELMRLRFLKELDDLTLAKKQAEVNITNEFVEKLNEKDVQLEELNETARQRAREHETIKQQIEDDADREIYDMKTNYEKQLTQEQDANVKLKGEATIYKKKVTAYLKEIDDLKHLVHTQENEQLKLKAIILNLEKDMADLKKEIAERDNTIQDKEKRIFELKRKNQELEKFKFILDFKINELKSQIEPRERRIREQMEQIGDMVKELENLQKIIVSLDVQLSELREKLKAVDMEIKREINKNRAAKAALKKIRTEIHNASGLIQDVPKLQRAVRDMYHKHNADKDLEIAEAEDRQCRNEFHRQRDFLEGTIRTLQTQISKTAVSVMDKLKLIEENSVLICETNDLRKDLKLERRKNQKMGAILGLHKVCTSFRETEKTLTDAVATRQDIHNQYRKIIEGNERCMKALEEENKRLLRDISYEMQHGQDDEIEDILLPKDVSSEAPIESRQCP